MLGHPSRYMRGILVPDLPSGFFVLIVCRSPYEKFWVDHKDKISALVGYVTKAPLISIQQIINKRVCPVFFPNWSKIVSSTYYMASFQMHKLKAYHILGLSWKLRPEEIPHPRSRPASVGYRCGFQPMDAECQPEVEQYLTFAKRERRPTQQHSTDHQQTRLPRFFSRRTVNTRKGITFRMVHRQSP